MADKNHNHNHANTNASTNANTNANVRVLRFEFASVLIESVSAFANVHRYDDRKTYKEAWMAWMAHDEIAALLKAEVARLSALGYKGDVADKLFKSGRYYFRGKVVTKPTNDDTNQTDNNGVTRKYVLLNRQLLDAMDDHIACGLRQIDAYTPAHGFAEFCKLNVEPYRSEVTRLSEIMTTGEAVSDKLKKTYKNRYFIMTKSGKAL